MVIVDDKSKCCGCAACANSCPFNCITMKFDEEGCEYPSVDTTTCIGCGTCERACPILNCAAEEPIPQRAFLLQHCDSKVLSESTSGGAFTAIAQHIIEQGGIVFGAAEFFNEAAGYPMVCHIAVESDAELAAFRNSKYTQSDIGYTMREVKDHLEKGREVLFSGTPCQVEGVKRYLGKEYANLTTVDLVCHAMTCRSVFQAYCDWLKEKTGRRPVRIVFRDKRKYGYRYSQICALDKFDNEPYYYAGVESDPFMRAFFSDMSTRPSCYVCSFKKRYRSSDITIWDCFEPARFSKEYDNNCGVTRALAHSYHGAAVLMACASYARILEIDADDAISDARELIHSVNGNQKRNAFMQDVVKSGADALQKWFPDSPRVKAERFARKLAERLGVYSQAKRFVKKVMGK